MSFHKDLVGADLHIARTASGAGSPVGVVTPGVVGEFYYDTSGTTLYVANGLTNLDWQPAGSGGGSPTGPASGDLSGTYPGPNVALVGGRAAASIANLYTGSAGVYSFGAYRDYAGANGAPQGTNEVQYVRCWLVAGATITKMRTHITSGANGSRQISMGIYDQSSPTSDTGTPNSRVATTGANVPPNATTGIYDVNLTSSYAVTTTGWYWLAIQCDNTTMAFLLSATYRANTVPRREETPGVFGLPASAGATTQPQSAALYCAAVE